MLASQYVQPDPRRCAVRTISVQQRRRLMVRRHHLAGDADDPETVTRAVIALHASDRGD
jgi:hypothetical protein